MVPVMLLVLYDAKKSQSMISIFMFTAAPVAAFGDMRTALLIRSHPPTLARWNDILMDGHGMWCRHSYYKKIDT